MIKKTLFQIVVITLAFFCNTIAFAQKQYASNPYVVYDIASDEIFFTIHYTFKDHYDHLQNYTLTLPVDFTNSEIAVFGIPKWLFDPFPDNEENRTIRKKELESGLFEIRDDMIEVDKSAVVERYAETFCKPVAQLIVRSLEEYNRDTRRDRIEMAMRFVQDIPYGIPEYADRERHYGGVSTPPGILINGYGDCDSKAILFAGILIYLVPADDFIFLIQPDHLLAAVKETHDDKDTYIEFDRETYLLAETAGPGKRMLGEKGNYYRDKFTAEKLNIISPATFPFKTPVSPHIPFSEMEAVADDCVVIQNASDRTLRFQLSPDYQHWKEFSLQENSTGNFKFNGEIQIFIRIRDKSEELTYQVQTGKVYHFTFNAKKKMWEFL